VSTTEPDSSQALADTVKASWQRFLETYEPLRAELYRYCRYLTRNPWDAEDLAQDALARAFVGMGQLTALPPNPRAWLLRVTSNSWKDRLRRQQHGAASLAWTTAAEAELGEERAAREAAGTLLVRLSPQERAAVVLKDVFELSLEEVAEALTTSVGAVKAALHRGRGKILEPEPDAPEQRALRPGVLDAFCAAFNARDLARLTRLLLDNASTEVVGATTEYGNDAARSRVFQGMLYGSARLAAPQTAGATQPDFMAGVLPVPPRAELRWLRGEWLCLLWYAHADGEAVRAINRIQIEENRIARIQNFFFTPELLADVCQELGVPFRSNGYRYCCSPAS
jgi:RNA polymerase sigma-70 factor (ECF subfamily)